jgi:hypothetical protein
MTIFYCVRYETPQTSRVAQLYSQALGSLFFAFYDSQGYGPCLGSYLNGRLCRVSVSYEMFVDRSYPWILLLIPQQRAGFQESTSAVFVSQEPCFRTRSLAMGLHVTLHKNTLSSKGTFRCSLQQIHT